jgi:hypothetical protein
MEEKICHKCHTAFLPMENTQGLVIDDNIFICENCHQNESVEAVVDELSSSKQVLGNGMPIALWLIKQQNKGKTFMSRKR